MTKRTEPTGAVLGYLEKKKWTKKDGDILTQPTPDQTKPKWLGWNCRCSKHCYRNYLSQPTSGQPDIETSEPPKP